MTFVGTWLAAGFRDDVAARLRALPTIAGDSIETSRASPIPQSQMPFIAVYTEMQDNQAHVGGTEPRFDTTLQLVVEPRVQNVPLAAAETDLDTLIGQILDGLLSDPEWVKQFSRISSVSIQTGYKNEAAEYTGMARIVFRLEYVERYPPRLNNPLTAIDVTVRHGEQQIGRVITFPTT